MVQVTTPYVQGGLRTKASKTGLYFEMRAFSCLNNSAQWHETCSATWRMRVNE